MPSDTTPSKRREAGTHPPWDFQVEVHVSDGRHTLCLGGDLDLASVPELEAAIRRLIVDANELVIDLEGLSFIDSAGLRCILACQSACERAGIAFLMTRGKSHVMRLFEITGMLGRLPFTEETTVCTP
jgi:anti-sigma B factor antagonist